MRRSLQGNPPWLRPAHPCARCSQHASQGSSDDHDAFQSYGRDIASGGTGQPDDSGGTGDRDGSDAPNIRAQYAYRRAITDQAVSGQISIPSRAQTLNPYRSYLGKSFVIAAAAAIICDRDGRPQVYTACDQRPPGASVGDIKTIPDGAIVSIIDVTNDARYVHAEGWGFTAIGNIQGGLYNETIGMNAAAYESEALCHQTVATHDCAIRSDAASVTYPRVEPRATIARGARVQVLQRTDDDHGNAQVELASGVVVWTRSANLAGQPGADGRFEVTDPQALIRRQLVTYPVTGGIVPQGERVFVLAGSPDTDPVGKYVRMARIAVDASGAHVRDQALAPVWVEAAALAHGWADFRGDNARWRRSSTDVLHGVYLGQMDVVFVIGRDSDTDLPQVETISAEMLEHYDDLVAAAAEDGHDIRLNSGFRTFAEQQALWEANPLPGQVARPGRSSHQNGIAIDIDTGGFQTPLYLWMKAHAPDYGFIRTVSGEHWHWEHRPADADAHGYRLPTVNP